MMKNHTFKIIADARRGTHECLDDLPLRVLQERLGRVMDLKKQAIKAAYRLFGPGCTRVIAAQLEAYNAQIDRLGVAIDERITPPLTPTAEDAALRPRSDREEN